MSNAQQGGGSGEGLRPFRIAIPQADIDDLKRRLADIRWPPKETVEGWEQGVPLAKAKELAAYWRDSYDWRRFEQQANVYPQFLTEIGGLDIHFFHVRSKHECAVFVSKHVSKSASCSLVTSPSNCGETTNLCMLENVGGGSLTPIHEPHPVRVVNFVPIYGHAVRDRNIRRAEASWWARKYKGGMDEGKSQAIYGCVTDCAAFRGASTCAGC